jgi:hypothetical protein
MAELTRDIRMTFEVIRLFQAQLKLFCFCFQASMFARPRGGPGTIAETSQIAMVCDFVILKDYLFQKLGDLSMHRPDATISMVL